MIELIRRVRTGDRTEKKQILFLRFVKIKLHMKVRAQDFLFFGNRAGPFLPFSSNFVSELHFSICLTLNI